MKVSDFHPSHYLNLLGDLALLIQCDTENGDMYIYSRFSNDSGKDHVIKSRVMEDSHGSTFFIRNKERYFLNDFMRIKF